MKVLVATQHFWPETFRITEVVQSLRDAGCEVTVLTAQPNYPEGVVQKGYSAWSLRTEVRDGLTICRVPLIPRGNGSAKRLVLNYLSFILSASVFGPWLLRGRSFDVVLCYATSPIFQAVPAVWIARLKGARLATWVQDLWPETLRATGFVRNRALLAAVAVGVRWLYRRNDLLLAQSHAFVPAVRALAGPTPVAYHPNPGELAFSRPPDEAACPLRLEPGFNVLFTGNLGTVQALPTVLAAAELLKGEEDVRFVLVGSGRLSAWLAEEIARLGLRNVRLAGRFDPVHMPAILDQASAVLVSLVRDPIMSQTVPSKMQAYLAAARPIIACLDGEGARVALESGAGVACAAEDAKGLAAVVRGLRDLDPEARRRMGESGRAYYQKHFEPESQARRLIRLLSGAPEALAQGTSHG
jgi:glycosyltransferase involved in cell wall biosynthesis